MHTRNLICAVIIIAFSVQTLGYLGNFDPITQVRNCRARVRQCSKHRFIELIRNRTAVVQNTTSPPGNSSDPAAGRRRRDAEMLPVNLMDFEGDSIFRYKRQDPNVTAAPIVPNVTLPTTTTPLPDYPESLTLPPPPPYSNYDLEDTFYSCLDDIPDPVCSLYKWQRCNWNSGVSPVINKYCQKWRITCTPCKAYQRG